MTSISSQPVSLKKCLNVWEHAEKIVLVKKSPDYLIVANGIVEDVPEAILQTEERLF